WGESTVHGITMDVPEVVSLEFSENSETILLNTGIDLLFLNSTDGNVQQKVETTGKEIIRSAGYFSPTSYYLLKNQTLSFHGISNHAKLREWHFEKDNATLLATSFPYIAAGAHLYSINSPNPLSGTYLPPVLGNAEFSEDGKYLAISGLTYPTIGVRDTHSGEVILRLDIPQESQVDVSSMHQTLLTYEGKGTLRDLNTGTVTDSWTHDSFFSNWFSDSYGLVQFSPNEELAVIVTQNKTTVFDMETQTLKWTLNSAEAKPTTIKIGPSSQLLAIGTDQGMVEIWNLSSGKLENEWQHQYKGTINAIAISNDGKNIVYGGMIVGPGQSGIVLRKLR
ncbi:MAG: hypothetical protein MI864_21355, partial [Pseudomonadales bacterium]|nr:hypothetical protein [Pseudomonadales bacterium]